MTTTGGKRRSLLYLGNWFDLPEYSSDEGYNLYRIKSPNRKILLRHFKPFKGFLASSVAGGSVFKRDAAKSA